MNTRRLLLGIGVAVVAIVIAIVVAASLINVNKFRPQIQAELQQKLKRQVTLGEMHLRLFPLSIKVDGLTIGEPAGFPSSPPFVAAKEVAASASLGSLLGGKPDIRDLTFSAPQVELIENAQGAWNFSNLGGDDPPPSSGNTRSFGLSQLKVENGQVAVTDERTKSPRSVYNHIDVTLTGFAPGKQFRITGDVHFAGPGKELLSFNGTGGPLSTTGEAMPMNGHVSVQEVSLEALNSLAGAQMKGTINGDFAVSGSAGNLQIQGNITAPNIQAQEIVLTNVKAACKLDNGLVQLAPVTAGMFGGQESGAITLDTKAPHPLCSVDTRLTGVDVNALLSAVSSLKNRVDGSLAAQGKLSFAVGSSANLASALNGVLSFDLTNGHFKGVNIAGELAQIGKFLNASALPSGNSTVVKRLSGTFNINNGIAATNNMTAILDLGSLSANGSVNLVNENLDMHVLAALSNALSKSVGGSGIGGFLNTALSNDKGELVLPVLVTGSMEHPLFTADVQTLARMKINHLLPTADNPGGILGALLDNGAGQKPAQKNQPQNPLNSLMNALGKKH